MESTVFLRVNETYDDFFNRCNNESHFDCTEEEMLWWLMGSRRLPLKEIVPLSAVLVVIFLTGVVGNICVCVVIVRHPGLHTATNYYLFSLAVSDLLLLLFGLPNDLSVYWHQYPYSLGIVFCKLRALISEAATYVSVLTISAFSLERYLAICHPLHLYAMAGLTRASRIILILWIISVLCASPYALYTDITYRDYPPSTAASSLTPEDLLKELSWGLKLKILHEMPHNQLQNQDEIPKGSHTDQSDLDRVVGLSYLRLARRRDKNDQATTSANSTNEENDMRLKLFRLMYETVRDSDLKFKRAELIKAHYVNSTAFEIGYLIGDITDKSNIIADMSMTLKRFHKEWKPIEHINAYEQIANQHIEITHLIDLVRVVNRKDNFQVTSMRAHGASF